MAGPGRVALALLLALAAGPGVGGCGKYGSPVRSAPREARDASAAEPDAAGSFEAEAPAGRSAEEDEDRQQDREQPEQGGSR